MRTPLSAPIMLTGALFSSGAHAFFEDVCPGKQPGQWINCVPKCDPDSATCVATSTVRAAQVPETARSMYHIDATYHIAMRLGFRADVAYWLVAYNEATDSGRYTPVDACGKPLTDTRFQTINLRGMSRADANGGTTWHISTAFAKTTLAASSGGDTAAAKEHTQQNVTGLFPYGRAFPNGGASWSTFAQPASSDYEGVLIAARRWGLPVNVSKAPLCTSGFTAPSGSSFFTGTECYRAGTSIQGALTGTPTNALTGLAPLQVECANGNCPPTQTTVTATVDQLPALLAEGTGVLWLSPGGAQKVPAAIARMGSYLHILQDRPSHATYCGDLEGTYNQFLGDGTIQVNYNENCGPGPHAITHMMEYGSESANLPLRSYQALSLTFDELVFFAKFVADASWLQPNPQNNGGRTAREMSDAELASLKGIVVGTVQKKCGESDDGEDDNTSECWAAGTAARPLKKASPGARFSQWKLVNNTYGLAPMPGWSTSYACTK